jgi:hydroxymethylglutaryl-CoA lyase
MVTGQVRIRLRDVTLRDGLQSEAVFVSTKTKLDLLGRIVEAGFRTLEVTSFVRGDRVPALRDADELTQRLPFHVGVEYRALVPNRRGVERFLSSPVETAIFFISASSAHNEANIQRTTEESLKEMADLIRLVTGEGRQAVGAVATAFVCPYAGVVPDDPLQRILEVFAKSGVKELSLADTVGKATPDMVYERCAKIKNQFSFLDLSLHLHDSNGHGLDNMLAGIQSGVYSFDVAQVGLGGCPYAPGAPGNLSALRVMDCLAMHGIETGLDIRKVRQLDRLVQQMLNWGHE